MKIIKEIFKEGETFLAGLGVFVGLPFLSSILSGKNFLSIIPELIGAVAVYTIVFVWILKGGLRRK